MEYLEYLIIVVILILIGLAIIKSKNKNFKIEANKLVVYLGGREIVNKDGIQKMGAQGIVEVEDQLKIILGEDARELKRYIDELKW